MHRRTPHSIGVGAQPDGHTARLTGGPAVWAPIILLELYLGFTVFVFFFGPVHWDVPSVPKLLAFLVINYASLWLGYSWGTSAGLRAARPFRTSEFEKLPSPISHLITISMVFCIFSTLIRVYAIRGSFEVVLSTFLSPGEAYRESQLIAQMDRDGEVMTIAGFSWAFRISTLLAVLNSIYFPLALSCWNKLGIQQKLLFFVALASTIVFAVGLGAQSGMGFLVFASLPVVLQKLYVSGRLRTPPAFSAAHAKTGWNRLSVRLLAVTMVCALMVTVVVFQADRLEATGRDLDAVDVLGGPFATPSDRWPTGDRFSYGVAMMFLYVSHGYEGLALAMEQPFEWTYGLGWSRALQVLLHDYLGGPDLFDRTYLARSEVQSGWPVQTWWSTIFPWIASDTTFYGTVFVMVLIGFVIGRLWVDAIATENPVAFAVLAQLFILVFMFPANNALAQTLDGFFALVGVFMIYGLSRKYFAGEHRALGPQRAPLPMRITVG
jgi:hypothetical protein